MASQPNDLSIPCSILFCLLLIFLNYPTSPSPEPQPDDHQQLPSLSLDDGDGDGDGDAFSTVQSDDWYWYFYYRLEDSGRRTRGGGSGGYNRTVKTGNGKWKATGKIRPVKDKKTNKQIGNKRTLVYYPNVVVPKPKAKPQAKVHSEWAIHEYQLLPGFPNPDKYVIVMLKKNVDKSVDKAQEAINLPEAEEINRDLASSSDAPDCEYPLLPTLPVNEISSHSFGMPNAEQVCNHHDLNDQNGHMEEELSFPPMISSPTDEHMEELQVPHCDTNSNIDLSPITQADWDEIFGLNDYEPSPQSIHLDQELQVPHCDTNFNIDLSPFTQADLDEIFELNDCEPSPQSPKHFEQIPQPSQGRDNARVTTVEP
ncbi:hypothetical protein ACFE04_004167 [Oxalis oulophora]